MDQIDLSENYSYSIVPCVKKTSEETTSQKL